MKLKESYVKPEYKTRPAFTTFPDCLRHYASIQPDREAVVFASTDGSRDAVTWKELYEKSCQVARSLITLGVKRNEFVANNIRNCPEWLYLTFGSMITGARPVSFTYKDESDVLAMMDKLGTCSLAAIDPGTDGDKFSLFKSIIDGHDRDCSVKSSKMPYLRYLICHGCPVETLGVKPLTELMSDEKLDVKLPKIYPNDIAVLFQTSGSTGVPKLVTHTHESAMFDRLEGVGSNDIVYNDSSFTWSGGFPFGVSLGQTRVTLSGLCPPPKNRISFLIDVVGREKCTAMFALPPILHELLERKDVFNEDWPVRTLITGGQPITRNVSVECIGALCENFVCTYGTTECSNVTANIVNHAKDFIEYSCGTVIDGNEVKVVDESERVVSVNTFGEIYVRNKGIFKEYHNDPEKTKAVKTADGWYKTDDIGRLTEDGVLFVEGRQSNMIISGGMNVSPARLETVIRSCPGVVDVVIVPVPDQFKHQIVCACVIINPRCDVTEDIIRSFCEEFHNDKLLTVLPSYYTFYEKFPETSTGKVSRKDLIAMSTMKFRKPNSFY